MKYFSLLFMLYCGLLSGQSKDIKYQSNPSDKIAFVIGNSKYANLAPLPNAVNDVDSISNALRLCGFEVYPYKNLTQQQMDEAQNLLASKLISNNYTTALWYYSGHGLEVNDQNYQVPIDAPAPEASNPNAIKCVHTRAVIDGIKDKVKFPIIILDACRSEVGRSVWGDFSEVSADGTFIGLSTGTGTKSWEIGKNGIFTTAFLQHIFTPCQSINDFFDEVKITCQQLAQRNGLPKQKPQPYARLDGKFYFVPCGTEIKRAASPQLADRDYDGTPDKDDPCPDQYGPKSRKGCPETDYGTDDSDGDGVADTADPCPMDKGTANGCPDADKDGVPDKSDRCKYVFGKADWEGCPDTDGDGIPDDKDKCPKEKGLKSKSGCPPEGFESFTENHLGLKLEMVAIPGGSYKMGSVGGKKNEQPTNVKNVTAFYLGKFEVTQAQWQQVLGKLPDNLTHSLCSSCPVVSASWADLELFLQELNTKSGKKYRLPTEVEWEYAARAGEPFTYSGSDNLDEVGYWAGNSRAQDFEKKTELKPVGQLKPNKFGLFDMSGNAEEYCSDWYKGYDGSDGIPDETNKTRVVRGGAFFQDRKNSAVSFRSMANPNNYYSSIGFRLALSK